MNLDTQQQSAVETEEWRVIKEFPNYAVSNFGRVKRIVESCRQYPAGAIRKISIGRGGYVYYRLFKNGKSRIKKAYHLVLEGFGNYRLSNKHQCNHKDGDKLNNSLSNLEWVTSSQNNLHAHRLGLAKTRKGEKSNLAKLHENEVWLIKKILAAKVVTHLFISKMFKVSPGTINLIKHGKTWAHVIYP